MLFESLALFGTVEVPGLDGSRTILRGLLKSRLAKTYSTT
jgi:hypothetical protein